MSALMSLQSHGVGESARIGRVFTAKTFASSLEPATASRSIISTRLRPRTTSLSRSYLQVAIMSQTSLFQVYLRLRPAMTPRSNEEWLLVEPPTRNESEETEETPHSTHIMLQPPNDSRKRAIERFSFTKVFQESASQLELFQETGAADNIVKSVLQSGRDGLIATLGVTGSGKV